MPQRKDPEIPVRLAVAVTPWPGVSSEKIEQLVTKKIEQKMAENAKVVKLESISRTSLSLVYVELDERLRDTGKEFDDIKLKLDRIHNLPEGAGLIRFIKDFGDTAALMLTVASPRGNEIDIALRSQAVQHAIERVWAQAAADLPGAGDLCDLCARPQNCPLGHGPNLKRRATPSGIATRRRRSSNPRTIGPSAGVSGLLIWQTAQLCFSVICLDTC